jgi:hypothetical protein
MSDAGRFLAEHRELGHAMRSSSAFEAVKREAALDIDEERLYIVRGDTLGTEEELFLEAVVRGAQRDEAEDPYRRVYLELDDQASSGGSGTEGGMA